MIVAGSASPLLLSSAGGYNLTNSLRFRSSASAYLNRTPASASNRKTWTWSAWIKRGTLGTTQRLFGAGPSDASSPFETLVSFTSADQLTVVINGNSGSIGGSAITSAVYRDPSAWYHVVAYVDMSASGQANKVRIYVNGVLQTVTYSSLGTTDDTQVNNNVIHRIGANSYALSSFFDGYLDEINFVDGQALTPSSFGATSATTGVWQPIKYAGTYGTNGFYLPFTDNSALTTSSNVGLGRDFSGNGNYWTTNNISITAGATYDSMTDVPTLTSPTTANYAVMNPLNKGSSMVIDGGNLNTSTSTNAATATYSTIKVSSPSYWEYFVNATNAAGYPLLGVGTGISLIGLTGGGSWTVGFDGYTYLNGTSANAGYTFAANDIIMIAYDTASGKLWFGKNNTWFGSGNPATGANPVATISTTTDVFAAIGHYGTSSVSANFGQRPFAYTPPTGFNRLNTFNLPTPTIGATASTLANKNMDISLWTGNNTNNRNITGLNFQPDLNWTKARSVGYDGLIADVVRTAGKSLTPSSTAAETTNSGNGYISAFTSDGFTLTQGSSSIVSVNESGQTYVGWNWKAGGAAVTNTAGTRTSQVSANTSAGFSIVTYTNQSSGVQTVGHGLGVAPAMIVVKFRSATSNWFVYHQSIGNTGGVFFDTTTGTITNSAYWNNTSPTSSVFTLGTIWNSTATAVAYCFAPVAGYSAFGSYTGNGSTDGPFVFTGFRPRFVMWKRSDSTGDWVVIDSQRNTFNVGTRMLFPNLSNAETDVGAIMDFTSNGFKLRFAGGASVNESGASYIYMAFAETPQKFALAR